MDVVLLHGFAASNFTWRDIVHPLSKRHRVIAVQRAWGPVDETARSTIETIRANECERPVLLGHSAGAELAAVIAASCEVDVRALVLEAPVIGTGAPRMARLLTRVPGLQVVAPTTLRAMTRIAFAGVMRTLWSDRSKVDQDVIDGYRAPLLRPGVMESMWELTASDNVVAVDWHALRGIPSLVIRGDSDRWVTPVELPRVREIVYSRCGHLPHEEHPTRFVADVEAFLDELAGSPNFCV